LSRWFSDFIQDLDEKQKFGGCRKNVKVNKFSLQLGNGYFFVVKINSKYKQLLVVCVKLTLTET
jgi:hypothetical protein